MLTAEQIGSLAESGSLQNSETPQKYAHPLMPKFPWRGFSRFCLSLEVSEDLRRLVAAECNDLPEIEALLQRWKEAGYPDLGAWPERFCQWEELVLVSP